MIFVMIYNVNTAAWVCGGWQGIMSLFVDGDLDVSALGPVSFKYKQAVFLDFWTYSPTLNAVFILR